MKKYLFVLLMAMTIICAFTMNAHAALVDLGGGLIYDEYLDITWLADANYAKTSGYDDDGAMSWADAMNWASILVYQGHDQWRLPTAYNQDGSGPCSHPDLCNDSEMGHLFYDELGGSQGSSIYDSSDPDLALFQNIQPYDTIGINDIYWTSTDAWSGRKWYFAFSNGSQWAKNPDDPNGHGWGVAWAVSDGRVAVVPEPASLLLFSTGLIGGFFRFFFQKKKIR